MSLPRLLAMGLLLSLSAAGPTRGASVPDPTHATPLGVPLLQRFGPQDYNAAPIQLSVARDNRGRMLFGNIEGILRYDGSTWQHIDIPGHGAGYSMARGADGHIYVGSYDTFGWLQTDASGQTRYQELMTRAGLHGEQRHVGMVWSVLPTPQGVYFRSERSLHFLDYAHRHVHNWPLPANARGFYVEGDDLYARYEGLGYGRVVDGRFDLVPGGRRFAHAPLAYMLPMHGWQLLVGYDGMYRADSRGIEPLPDHAGRALSGHQPYVATRLPDGGIAVGCRDGMLFQYGPDLHLLHSVNLGHFSIRALDNDRENGLWATTEGGLVRIDMPSPWSFLGGQQGVNGTISDFAWYENALWLAGSDGISRVVAGRDGPQIEHEPWTTYEAFDMLATDHGLLIAHRDGLLVLDPGRRKPRVLLGKNAGSVYIVQASRFDPKLAYALGEHELILLRLRGGHWQRAAQLETGNLSASDLIETASGTLWMNNSRGGPQRWRIDTHSGRLIGRKSFGASEGLQLDPHTGSVIYRLDGVLHVISGKHDFRFDGKRFIADNAPPFSLVDRPEELLVTHTRLGTYAYTSRQLWHRAPGRSSWTRLKLDPGLAAGYGSLRLNHDGVLRISTWNGLLQYDPRQHESKTPTLKLYLDTLSIRPTQGGDKNRDLPLPDTDAPIEIPPGQTVTLRYSMVSMNGARFRFRMPGVMPDWSDWRGGEIFLSALPAGLHTLQVQARPRHGGTVVSRNFHFDILPHWYQRWWAWLTGIVVLALLSAISVRTLVQRKTRRYRRANRKLEARISERTRELREANRLLAELATEDALTGVANRRALEQGMQREWMRCMDQRRPLSALMIDIDHFKQFNDRHGHLEGDHCLAAFAQLLRNQHNPDRELLARYGGEEFALLLPGLTLEQALGRAGNLHASIAASDLGITVSIGVAGFIPDPDLHPEKLLEQANAALYHAKRTGRNRVESAPGEASDPG